MRDTSGNADSQDTESGFLFHKSHDGETQGGTGQTVQNTEKITEHKSDHKDTDDRNKCGLFPGVFFEDEEDCQI